MITTRTRHEFYYNKVQKGLVVINLRSFAAMIAVLSTSAILSNVIWRSRLGGRPSAVEMQLRPVGFIMRPLGEEWSLYGFRRINFEGLT